MRCDADESTLIKYAVKRARLAYGSHRPNDGLADVQELCDDLAERVCSRKGPLMVRGVTNPESHIGNTGCFAIAQAIDLEAKCLVVSAGAVEAALELLDGPSLASTAGHHALALLVSLLAHDAHDACSKPFVPAAAVALSRLACKPPAHTNLLIRDLAELAGSPSSDATPSLHAASLMTLLAAGAQLPGATASERSRLFSSMVHARVDELVLSMVRRWAHAVDVRTDPRIARSRKATTQLLDAFRQLEALNSEHHEASTLE